MSRTIRVTVWNEYVHEREIPAIAAVYPEGIHGCIRRFLSREEDIAVTCVTLDMPHQGITRELLAGTDVLIWWSHARQEDVTDETVRLVREAVHAGMGLIALHSAHFSRIMRDLMGTTMTLHWRHGDSEKLWCIAPAHPIARGVPACIDLPAEEMYGEPFDIPRPDDIVFLGWFASGHVFRSGMTFIRGMGRIFYFQPGHEEAPVYEQPEIQRIITNAVRWAAPVCRLDGPPDNVAE
ncbi:MAG: ThuA domain-containing protein [Clostridia bacterium]|nr:ThuA domain-containing protein [Clostridia bacterium]